MTENKFTDDEIIRALEICIGGGNCKDCPYDKIGCGYEKDALDLINRQKAENERLKDINKHLDAFVLVARAVAIKEFAEKLKFEFDDFYYSNEDALLETADLIDSLVKEMTEAGNEII